MDQLDEILRSEVNRRAFITRMGAAGLGAAAVSLLAGCGGSSATTAVSGFGDPVNFPGIQGRSQDDLVLNFALTLEILEADLYRQALNKASGRPAGAALDATAPTSPSDRGSYTRTIPTGAFANQQLADVAFLYLVQYAYVEAAHRDFLNVAIQSSGGTPVTRNPGGYNFPLGDDLFSITGLIYAVEETGVRAYLGAAPFMSNAAITNGLLATAVAIHSTEARHSAAVAYTLGLEAGPVFALAGVTPGRRVTDGVAAAVGAPYRQQTFQYFSDPAVVLNAVQPFFG
ncbi:MAG: ferritin-like domain-containing protein [Cytophagales bacterium]|nr:ferritin-like domain-containing protein [Armatimonadota bacterium]